MITEDYKLSYVFFFALVSDRSKVLGLPLIALRWFILIGSLATVVSLTIQSQWLPALVALGIAVIFCGALYLHALLLAKFQLSGQRRLYREFASYAGLPSLVYSDLRSNRKHLKTRLKMSWSGRRLLAVTLYGEGGKISRSTAAKFLSWVSNAYQGDSSMSYILVNQESIPNGVLQAEAVVKDSYEDKLDKARVKIFNVVTSSVILGIKDWPKIKIHEFDPEKKVPFSRVTLSELDDRRFESSHSIASVATLMAKAFPLKEPETWRLEQNRSDELELFIGELRGDELYGEKYKALLSNIVDFFKSRLNLTGAGFYFSYKIAEPKFEGSSDKLLKFKVEFQSIGRLGEPELAANFVEGISHILSKKLGGSWSGTNEIFESNSIIFKSGL